MFSHSLRGCVLYAALLACLSSPRAAEAADGASAAPNAPTARKSPPPLPRVISIGRSKEPLPPASAAPFQLVRVYLDPPAVGQPCRGEFAVRNNGADIAPNPRADLYTVALEIRTASKVAVFRNRWRRVGTGIARGEVVAGAWDTKFNTAVDSPGVYPPFVMPSPGEYELTASLFRPGDDQPVDSSTQWFSVPDALGDLRSGVRLKLTRCEVTPSSVGAVCAGEFDVRNDGPAIAPSPKDVFRATVEIFDINGAPLFRGQIARAGANGMPAGEVGTARWDTKSNALDRGADGIFQRFTFTRPGEYPARVTLTRDGVVGTLDTRDLKIKVGPRFAAAPAPAPPVQPPATRPAEGTVRITGAMVSPAYAGEACAGEFVTRNDGPDIAPKDDTFHATIEIYDAGGKQLYRSTMSRNGVGTPSGKVVRVRWKTDNNFLGNSGGSGTRFLLPRAGEYVARVTLAWEGHGGLLDVREERFRATDRPAAVAGAQGLFEQPAPAPTALRVERSSVDRPCEGSPLSGRFFVVNTGRPYQTPPGARPAAWRVTVQDEDRRPLFEATGSWGPGLRESEDLEIAWDTRRRGPFGAAGPAFVLPRAGEYAVRVELFASDDFRATLTTAVTRVVATPAGK